MGSMHTTAAGAIDFAADVATLFPDRSCRHGIAAGSEAGFEAVELSLASGEPDAIAPEARRHGMRVILLGLAPAGDGGNDGGGQILSSSIESAAATAATIGCRSVNWPAAIPSAAPARDGLVDALRRAASQLMPRGFRLLFEPLNAPIDEGVRLLQEVDARNLSLACDVERMHRSGERVCDAVARHLTRIAHVRIAPGPFSGNGVDHEELLLLLDRIGYRAWVGCSQPSSGSINFSMLRRHGLGRRQVVSYAPVSAPRQLAPV
jgi:hydroxypyruvate isomerase